MPLKMCLLCKMDFVVTMRRRMFKLKDGHCLCRCHAGSRVFEEIFLWLMQDADLVMKCWYSLIPY